MPSAATWVDPEPTILAQRKTNIWHHLYVKPKKGYRWTYLQNRLRVADVENKLTITRGKGGGEDKLEDWDWHTHTAAATAAAAAKLLQSCPTLGNPIDGIYKTGN